MTQLRIKKGPALVNGSTRIFLLAALATLHGHFQSSAAAAAADLAIVSPRGATAMETLAAREVRRYVYLRTGRLLPIVQAENELAAAGVIVVAQKDRPVVSAVVGTTADVPGSLSSVVAGLKAEQYCLRSLRAKGRPVVLVAGGDALGTLYGAYRLAEHLGVRFYLHGDVVPDDRLFLTAPSTVTGKGAEKLQRFSQQTPLRLPSLEEVGRPLFALRGIQPFHDFPEGPDWWNLDDYKAVFSQLPKLRMNFFGLHTYPEGGPNAEPTVWIGTPNNIGEGSAVKFSYPSSYQNTLRGNWGYAPKKTSDYTFGAAQLFERDDFGAEVMWGHIPNPTNAAGHNEVFSRAAGLLREAFTHARRLGIQTCVGTETALTVPKLVRDRLKQQGKDAKDQAVKQELYEGLFRRAAQVYPLDYYWFWTPEGWTWEGTKPEQIAAVTNDLNAAIAAHKKVNPPFKLATCGWVLGPQQDRAMFDKILPKDIAVSCINREVGKTPVDKGFVEVKGRGKWAIPWLEDDPALTSMQLWAGRMRRDAFDALRYGCDGLLGIHWRTRVLGPAVSALAQAAWEQGDWADEARRQAEPPRQPGPVGGKFANFPNNQIADTEDGPLYQTVRYNVLAYHLSVPNGSYTVTLKFCEPNYKEAGKRAFDVIVQGQREIENLDIFARVGKDRAFDFTYTNVAVSDGWLDITFAPRVEYPSIAAIVVEGPVTKKINCGGPAYKDFEADWPEDKATDRQKFPPVGDFYRDWARAQFGREITEPAAAIFARIDGKLPRPSDWIHGPGGIRPDARKWAEVKKDYAFADELATLAPRVSGAGSRERFAWWLNTFRTMQAMGELNCKWGEYTNAVGEVKTEKNAAKQRELARQSLLPLRREKIALLGKVYDHLLATVSNPGELGTVMNWESHCQPDLLGKTGDELAKLLGEALPADAQPPKAYRGPMRVIVPTVRSSFAPGERLELRVLILSEQPPADAAVYWRTMGRGDFTKAPLTSVSRGVYSATFGGGSDDLEYYVKVAPAKGRAVHFPATAPRTGQTLVAMP
ncbi:MAG: hypothetical protein HZA90_13460 [Verrucomicrobia bacterium]|nr:hypothetical protein [Verrucomicrobiota bacterium]